MALTKLEIQQMLREMNVKFSADETYDALKLRLQQENHSLWLKSVSNNRSGGNDSRRVVVRKRKRGTSDGETAGTDAPSDQKPVFEKDTRRGTTGQGHKPETAYVPRAIEKPESGKPWKAAADGTQPFNRTKNVFQSVLKRAKHCCEHCGAKAGTDPDGKELVPFYIQPISGGGEHSIKNMVALCPVCVAVMEAGPSAKDIKELKRKTRSRLYGSLQVVRKKKTPARHDPVPNPK
jgi:hypothetical protein